MTKDTKQHATDTADAPEVAVKKPRRRVRRPAPVAIRGRVATTMLAAGEEATVERTAQVDALLARGYVELVE